MLPRFFAPHLAVSSFGAITHEQYVYVYGGHVGKAHAHSKGNLSMHFRRVDLHTLAWEDLPMERPLQGLALVAHDRFLYRVGGMEARNTANEAEDLHSVTDFARFDPESKRWDALPPLPAGRSSHDAVVVGDTLYVLGGWRLAGGSDGAWHDKSLALDLSKSPMVWHELPTQPFHRRTLAAATANDCVFALCGMNSDGDVDRRVDCYDPATKRWTRVADLPGTGMNGFGIAAWSYRGTIHASGSNGVVYCLHESGSHWDDVARLTQPRVFHRLVPHPSGGLLVLGGASIGGHLKSAEWLPLE